jgi:hypothetical protein
MWTRRLDKVPFLHNQKKEVSYSVADLGCLSRIPDPDFLSIPDPGSKNSKKG